MPWIEPKTNWQPSDYLNAADYNRMRGNLFYLRDLGTTLYPAFSVPDTGAKSTASFAFANDINALENSIDIIAAHTFHPSTLPHTKAWRENSAAPVAEDLNRIESATLILYCALTSQSALRPKLAFGLLKGAF
ncbi:MAG: hypothetical protein RSF84_05280 [Ruthenibacterium sp.]